MIGFYKSEETFYLLQLLGRAYDVLVEDDGHTLGSVFIDLTPVNTPLSIGMEGITFYTFCLTPDWITRIFETMCFGTLNLSSRLSGTMCSNRME